MYTEKEINEMLQKAFDANDSNQVREIYVHHYPSGYRKPMLRRYQAFSSQEPGLRKFGEYLSTIPEEKWTPMSFS